MDISANFRVETIENGFVVSHKESARKVHVSYRWDVARQIERFLHDELVKRLEDQAALEGEAREDLSLAAMQNEEG